MIGSVGASAFGTTRREGGGGIDQVLLDAYPQLRDNPAQMRSVAHSEGPLLIIAGPGSGKTQVLVWRTLNLLLTGKAEPAEILVCTFTEKAAYELRDRISLDAKKVGYEGDLSDLLVGTIHGICNRFLLKYRHRTRLLAGYDTLDDLTQQLFLNDHFDEIFGEPDENERYLGRWTTKWGAIENLIPYLNKIAEELVDPERLVGRSGSLHGRGRPRLRRLRRAAPCSPTRSTSLTSRRSSCSSSSSRTSARRSPAGSSTRWSTSTRTRTTSRRSSSCAWPGRR